SYVAPYSEAPMAWLLCGLGSLISAISVGSWNPQLLLLPVHATVVQLVVWVIVIVRRRSVPRSPGRAASDPQLNLV
ncbi:MAG TPA: hypothetical protein VI322_00465, partial [Candidatus Saccharimonadia bacterium]